MKSHSSKANKETPTQQKKIKKVMKEFKEGDLKSSHGEKVKDRDQAIAIAMSEAGISRKSSPNSPKSPHKKKIT